MATALETTTWTFSPDVLTFAHEKGIDGLLLPLVHVTQRVFPDLRRLEVFVEEDWEIDGLRFIMFEIIVPPPADGIPMDSWAEGVATQQQTWSSELVNLCPAPLLLTFCLRVDVDK